MSLHVYVSRSEEGVAEFWTTQLASSKTVTHSHTRASVVITYSTADLTSLKQRAENIQLNGFCKTNTLLKKDLEVSAHLYYSLHKPNLDEVGPCSLAIIKSS